MPGCTSVAANRALADLGFELGERAGNDASEARAIQGQSLLLGIVQIVDVNRGEAKIRKTALNLVRKKCGTERMTAAHDIRSCHNSLVEVLSRQISVVQFARVRR